MKPQQKAVTKVQQSTAIEKHKSEEEVLPEYLRRKPGTIQAGFEEVQQGDMTVPQMRLCQSLTPQRDSSEPKYIDGLKEGEHFNTVTGANYGKLVQIVPLMFFKNRIYFRDKKEGGGILCRSENMIDGIGEPGGKCEVCPLNQFGSAKGGEGKGKACTEFYNFPAMIVDEDGLIHPEGLVVKSFKSSGVPVAKDWLALMRLRGIDMFGGVYEITSQKKTFTEGTSYLEVVKNAGVVKKETHEAAEKMYSMFLEMRKQGRIKVDQEIDEPGANDQV